MRSLDRLVPEHVPALDPVGRALAERLLEAAAWVTGHAMVVREQSQVVGAGGVRGLGPGSTPVLECWINEAARGRGHGRFALEALLDFAFDSLRLERLAADAPGPNPAGARLLAGLGFAPVGPGGRYGLAREAWH